ncbi:MAG: hypothetical protein ACREDR_28915, partial [Blastocatellia bacterium]
TINSSGFAHALADAIGLKPGQIKRGVHATTVTAGPARSSYPILVQITATTESSGDSVKLAQAVADEITRRHNAVFDRALSPHLAYQQTVEWMLVSAGFPPNSPVSPASGTSTQTASAAGRTASDEVIKLERELQDVKTSNSAPTFTERTHLLDRVVATGAIAPGLLRPTITAALITLVVAVVLILLAQSLTPPQDAARPEPHTDAPGPRSDPDA